MEFKTYITRIQLMDNLRKHWFTLERPFITCGVNYSGSISAKFNEVWNAQLIKKIYLFIYFTTEAIHIKADSNITVNAFIAAFGLISSALEGYSPSHLQQ